MLLILNPKMGMNLKTKRLGEPPFLRIDNYVVISFLFDFVIFLLQCRTMCYVTKNKPSVYP